MSEKRLIGCGMVILATAAIVVAVGRGIEEDAARPAPLHPASLIDDVMASPRVSSLHHAPTEDAEQHASTAGAIENYPRADEGTVVCVARRVVSSPGQNAQVQACGCTSDAGGFPGRVSIMGDLAEDVERMRGASIETGSSEEVASCPWITGATGGARGVRAGCGIALSKADGPVRRRRPASCRRGGRVNVVLRSGPSRRLGPSRGTATREGGTATDLPSACRACDREVAHVTIHGTDDFVWWVGPHEEVAVSPRVTNARHTPNTTSRNALSLDEDDLSDSGVYGRIDPGVFVHQKNRDVEVPFIGTTHNLIGSCWLFGGGFLGGFFTHPKTPVYAQRGGHATDEDTAC
jgi:hypothetical protein